MIGTARTLDEQIQRPEVPPLRDKPRPYVDRRSPASLRVPDQEIAGGGLETGKSVVWAFRREPPSCAGVGAPLKYLTPLQGPQECRDRIARSEQRRRFAVAAASASAASPTGLDGAPPPADFVHGELRNLQRISARYGCGVGSPILTEPRRDVARGLRRTRARCPQLRGDSEPIDPRAPPARTARVHFRGINCRKCAGRAPRASDADEHSHPLGSAV
jgi:hypothetical protein